MAAQRMFDGCNDDRKSEHSNPEKRRADSAFVGAPSNAIANYTDDGGAGIPSPVELARRRRNQNRDADHKGDGGCGG